MRIIALSYMHFKKWQNNNVSDDDAIERRATNNNRITCTIIKFMIQKRRKKAMDRKIGIKIYFPSTL